MFDLYKSNNPKETLMYDTTFFLIGIHSRQDWITTMRHGVIKKKMHKKIKSVWKEPSIKTCLQSRLKAI